MKFPEPFYRWRPHPWHGLEVGPDPPTVVHAYIEIYDCAHALKVVETSQNDYQSHFGD